MMLKRAVSPLIATILLVALTVSIGAMIIGWGRQYVQQQTACLGIEMEILGYAENPKDIGTDYIFKFQVENVGTRPITNDSLQIVAIDKNGVSHYCEVNTYSSRGCNYTFPGLPVGALGYLTLQIKKDKFGNSYPVEIYARIPKCGRISNSYYP